MVFIEYFFLIGITVSIIAFFVIDKIDFKHKSNH